MNYTNRRYLIIPTTVIDQINFNEVFETSAETLRLSVDGTETFVKYDVTVVSETYTQTFINADTGLEETMTVEAGTYGRPSIYSTTYVEYTHEDILSLLSTEAWSSPITREI
jgi:hypothetical protein